MKFVLETRHITCYFLSLFLLSNPHHVIVSSLCSFCIFYILGSWIVTCGTESGVVQFIEDAVNEYVALEDLHIPIVGLLSQGVLDKVIEI